MKIKNGMEQAHANFTTEQQTTENGRALLNFVEAWSGMMEYGLSLYTGCLSEYSRAAERYRRSNSQSLSANVHVTEGAG